MKFIKKMKIIKFPISYAFFIFSILLLASFYFTQYILVYQNDSTVMNAVKNKLDSA